MSENKRPFTITFSGQNGSGKSTIISQMKDSIELCADLKVDVFKAPLYSSETGEKIRAFLAGKKIVEDIEELFHQNRMEVNAQVLASEADVILLDRWTLDAVVYARFRNMTPLFSGEIIPDMCVYVDVKSTVLKKRLPEREDQRRYSGHHVEEIGQLFEGAVGLPIIGHNFCRATNNNRRDLDKIVRTLTDCVVQGEKVL